MTAGTRASVDRARRISRLQALELHAAKEAYRVLYAEQLAIEARISRSDRYLAQANSLAASSASRTGAALRRASELVDVQLDYKHKLSEQHLASTRRLDAAGELMRMELQRNEKLQQVVMQRSIALDHEQQREEESEATDLWSMGRVGR